MSLGQVASKIYDLERDTSWMKTSDSAQRLASVLLSIPYLRAGWTMAQVDYAAATQANALGTGYSLTNMNAAQFGADGAAPYVEFDGVNQCLYRADGGAGNWADITGTEAYIPAAQRGLTMGCWFYVNSWTPLSDPFLMNKNNIASRAYFTSITRASPHTLGFGIAGPGGNNSVTLTPAVVPSTGQWYYHAARFIPSTELKVYWGAGGPLETATNVVAIEPSIVDTAAPFVLGAALTPALAMTGFPIDGRMSCAWLCAGALSDAWVTCIYSQLRSIFQV